MANKKYSRVKMFGLYTLSLMINLLPLIIVLAIKWEACTKTKREGVALTITGFIWVFFLITSMIGALPKSANRVVVLTVVFVVLELMKPLLSYMCIFSASATIGAMLDLIILKPIITRYKELRVATKTANLTTEMVKDAVKEVVESGGTGRV